MTHAAPEVGRIVRSKAGRDAGRLFLAVAAFDEEHLLIADGDLRKVEKPKKKKIRHLEATAHRFEVPAVGKLKNAEIRKLIENATGEEG
jgi:ribosomal protein L14E/L6E/L27E